MGGVGVGRGEGLGRLGGRGSGGLGGGGGGGGGGGMVPCEQKWAGAGDRWAEGGGKKSEFWAGVPRYKIRKKGAGVGGNWVGVGGLNPGGRGSRPHPNLPPHHHTPVLPHNIRLWHIVTPKTDRHFRSNLCGCCFYMTPCAFIRGQLGLRLLSLPASVCVCVHVCQTRVCPRDNSPIPVRSTKFRPEVQSTLVKI